MKVRLASFSITVAFAALALPARAELPVIQISGANFRPMPLAVASPLTSQTSSGDVAEFDQALLFDLSAAGLFQVLDRKGFLADPKESLRADNISFSRWADVGAEALVKTQLTGEGGNIRAELRLYSVHPGKEELKLTESAPARDMRRVAHTFADALYRHFTREMGPFRSKLTFVKKSASGKDVWVSDWDGKNARPATSGGINILPSLAPDGVTLAYTTYRSGKPEIWVQRGGSTQASALIQSGQLAAGLAFSPDGRRIAYSVAQGESAQIYVARADGSEATALTNTPFFINSSPAWSPDGKRLAFVSNRSGSPQIYTMTAEGKDVRRLTFKGNYNQTPDWSPRGDLVAFTARDERNNFDLFTVNVENGKVTRLTQDAGKNEEPTFAPNGRLIMFTSTRNGTPQLFVMTAEGNNAQALPVEAGSYLTPEWGAVNP